MAGLFSSIVSPALLVDFSPPEADLVIDIDPFQVNKTSISFKTKSSSLCVKWREFHDPHSHLIGCQLQFGSCPSCSDVSPWTDVGIASEFCIDELSLSHAHTYYGTVRCCNQVNLCSEATSSGVMIDSTPPSSGKLILGAHHSTVHYSK